MTKRVGRAENTTVCRSGSGCLRLNLLRATRRSRSDRRPEGVRRPGPVGWASIPHRLTPPPPQTITQVQLPGDDSHEPDSQPRIPPAARAHVLYGLRGWYVAAQAEVDQRAP